MFCWSNTLIYDTIYSNILHKIIHKNTCACNGVGNNNMTSVIESIYFIFLYVLRVICILICIMYVCLVYFIQCLLSVANNKKVFRNL